MLRLLEKYGKRSSKDRLFSLFKFIRFMDAQMFGEIEFAFSKGPRNGEKFKI
jgi:hypothetical protein